MRDAHYHPGWPPLPPRRVSRISAIQRARRKWHRRYKDHHRSNRRFSNRAYGNIGYKVRWWLRKQQSCRKKQLRSTPVRLNHKGPGDIKSRLGELNTYKARNYWKHRRGKRRTEVLRAAKDRLLYRREPASAWDRGSRFEQPAKR